MNSKNYLEVILCFSLVVILALTDEALKLWKSYKLWFFYGIFVGLSILFVNYAFLRNLFPHRADDFSQKAGTLLDEPIALYTPALIAYLLVWTRFISKSPWKWLKECMNIISGNATITLRDLFGAVILYFASLSLIVLTAEMFIRNSNFGSLATFLTIFFLGLYTLSLRLSSSFEFHLSKVIENPSKRQFVTINTLIFLAWTLLIGYFIYVQG